METAQGVGVLKVDPDLCQSEFGGLGEFLSTLTREIAVQFSKGELEVTHPNSPNSLCRQFGIGAAA